MAPSEQLKSRSPCLLQLIPHIFCPWYLPACAILALSIAHLTLLFSQSVSYCFISSSNLSCSLFLVYNQ